MMLMACREKKGVMSFGNDCFHLYQLAEASAYKDREPGKIRC